MISIGVHVSLPLLLSSCCWSILNPLLLGKTSTSSVWSSDVMIVALGRPVEISWVSVGVSSPLLLSSGSWSILNPLVFKTDVRSVRDSRVGLHSLDVTIVLHVSSPGLPLLLTSWTRLSSLENAEFLKSLLFHLELLSVFLEGIETNGKFVIGVLLNNVEFLKSLFLHLEGLTVLLECIESNGELLGSSVASK